MATRSKISQNVDTKNANRIDMLASRLDVPKTRLLNEILNSPNLELVVEAIRKPAAASRRLDTMGTLQQGQEIGEAVVRYLETRDELLNPHSTLRGGKGKE